MRVVVVGSGGREHALAFMLSKEHEVVVAPGSSALGQYFDLSDKDPLDIDADLYVIGPEQPLVEGLADRLRGHSKTVFGPSKDGARLEGSKAFLKDVLVAAKVPTAEHRSFSDISSALSYVESMKPPYVIKTDGLAEGKGVLVTERLDEAKEDIVAKMTGQRFKGAGRTIVIEEALLGRELSLFALCDGRSAVALPAATDYKRLLEGNEGPNTGGMGAYAPLGWASDSLQEEILDTLVKPTLQELLRRGIQYRGVLYAGVMVTESGPKIIEFNVRFGDPETQVVLPKVEEGLGDILFGCAVGEIGTSLKVSPKSLLTVVLAAPGYPASTQTGAEITGVQRASEKDGVKVFFAGTSYDSERDAFYVSGGRVMAVTGEAPTLQEARSRAYSAVSEISFEGMHYRRDIGA